MAETTVRTAACACGGLSITLSGEPAMVSSCCCLQCQRRTGSLFGVTAFFAEAQVTAVEGEETTFRRIGHSGKGLNFHFCPRCGSTVYWEPEARPGRVAVAAGAFADPGFPAPQRMIWTESRHPWVCTPDDLPLHPQSP